jgi:hypothetical protein
MGGAKKISRRKLDPNIRHRRDQQAPGDNLRTTMKENFDAQSDFTRGASRRNGRTEAPNRLPAVLARSRCFCGGQNAQRSAGARSAQGATRDQSLSPADARRPQLAEHGQTLIMLARFQQRNERQKVPDKGATPMPSDVETMSMEGRNIEHTLNLSASRVYDSALEILGAYKLTGNFHVNLEIVLKDIDALDKVTFEVEPRSQRTYLTDCRHVRFRPNKDVHMGQFSEIIRSIKGRVGFDGTQPWWARVFH